VFSDKFSIKGWVEVIVRDKNGNIKYLVKYGRDNPGTALPVGALPTTQVLYYWRKNIITNAGLAEIVKLVFGLGGTAFKYLAIGTGTTAETASDTALEAEIARKQATITQTTTSVSKDTALLEATFSSADDLSGTQNISEAGVFNASSGGTLLARKTFSAVPVNFDAGDSITIKYYIQFSR